MKILVPIDQTEVSEAALPYAERIARERGGEIVLVGVGEIAETSAQAKEAESAIASRLTEVAADIHGVEVSRQVHLAGDPVRGIMEVAHEVGADYIVTSAHDADGLGERVNHEVAEELAAESGIDVAIVRPVAARHD